jgi:GT2 family glycosyltransferase
MEQINLHNSIVEQQYCSKVGVDLRLNGERSSVRFSFSRNGFIEFFRIKGSDINIIVNGTTHVLNPMKPTLISVSNDVLISRPKGAKGHILVSKLFLEDVVLDEVIEAPTFVSNDIDLFLRKIGRASGIKKTDFGIFASELAEIDNEADILDLQTDPPNGWVRKGNKIVFIYPCRIFDVIMNTNAVIDNHVPNDIIVASKMQAERENLNQAVQKTVENNIKNKERAMSEIVIDSSVDILASSLEKCNKVAGGIVMSSMGKFIIPLALLEPNTTYNISLSSRIINGNGRFGLQLTSNSGTIYQNIIGNNNICVDVCSGSIGFGETYFLNVYRPAKMSTGSLLINNVKITKTNSPNYNYNIQNVSQPTLKQNIDYVLPWKTVVPLYINNLEDKCKKASILISTYNRPELLRFGLSSIAKQDFDKSDVEIIVLNDYLPDDTERVCDEFPDLDIKYIFTGQRNLNSIVSRVPGYAINVGARIAKGKFIFISCAEIYHMDNTISSMLKILENSEKTITTCIGKEDSGRFLNKLKEGSINVEIDFVKEKIIEKDPTAMELPYFIGLNKQYFFDIGGYDEDFIGLVADDNDLSDRLKKIGCNYHYTSDRIIHLYHDRLLLNGKNLKIKNENVQHRVDFNRKLYNDRKEIIIRNNNNWGNVKMIHRNNEWKLKNIPKIIHFYWGGTKLSFLRYLSIYSFRKQNPDWKIKLHVPEVLGAIVPTWNTVEQKISKSIQDHGDNCFDLIPGLDVEIITHNFDKWGFSNTAHEVHKSDFIRWILLSSEGGVWSDMDILYTMPINYMIDNNENNVNIRTCACAYIDGCHAIGFLMSSQNNDYYQKISNLAKKKFRAKDYQSMGNKLFIKTDGVLYINEQAVYSIQNIDQFFNYNLNLEDYPNAIGFHWYGGHPRTANLENIITTFAGDEGTFIGKIVKYIGAK